ncbi:hypothetical protein TVAG_402080 [Trichomonas vaginalis G3]|uniref:Uncharacterized protein n=1 Tax=Trichomonas vaginalis (strain ATCC PRA-98 / G3) TaxID=412133 RepID=A2DHW5_TRIV3|nr:armadillo (ARM) repeat-containing protein family [Trichomonas vaginalis G3]EAY19954.1 hypothetical protein TVAG_402080 [Trichomonas vaginalis G3]KAI5525904.1 armadillo (ARM) repeat-containing protein family [Trichomonas vaginalis G3]|eukprot:XP_001580940.1 hypothetical protein [Trichomonas vaginalis G3]
MSILEHDPSLRFLVDAYVNQRNPPKEKLVAELGKLRMGFSYNWLEKFRDSNINQSLAVVLNAIFRYADHSEPTVRIGAYNALGGLLMCVTPFISHEFTESFNKAVAPLPISPKVSIAIINTFVYLTRFISPVRINDFVSKVQVSTHFNVDMTENLKYLPQIIPLMTNLPLEFHQNILRSLVFKCGRNPNAAFVSCVVSLIDCKNQLLSLLEQFIQENNLSICAIWLGPQILSNRKNYDALSEKGKHLFIDAALEELSRESATNLSVFESSCMICSLHLNYIKGTPEYDSFYEKIRQFTQKQYSSVYKVRLFLLPTPLEELKDDAKDNDQIKAAKLQAIASYFEANENCDADVIAEMLLKYKNSENDLYCVLIESFARCIKGMLRRCKKRLHLQLLELILRTKNKNWVHDEAVTKVIDEIEPNLIPRYVDLVVDRLIEFSLSSNERLCKSAIKSFVRFSSYSNIDMILNRLMWSDWIDDLVCEKRFKLLSKLAKYFKTPQFSYFVQIAYEVLEQYDDTRVTPNAFLFLSRVPEKIIPDRVREYTFRYIVKYWQQYTQSSVDSSLKKYVDKSIDTPFLDSIDTDIVSNPVLSHKKALRHIRNAFLFMCSLSTDQIRDINSLFMISLKLIPVFDIIALEEAILMYNANPNNFNLFWDMNQYLLMTTSDDTVAASCLSLIIRTGKPIPENIQQIARAFLDDDVIENTDLFFFSFVIMDMIDHEFAMASVDKLLKRITKTSQISLLYRLLHVSGQSILPKISDDKALAFIEYSNEQNGRYDEKIENYLKENTITEWLINDVPINRNLTVFLQRKSEVKWHLTKSDTFTSLHWEYIFSHRDNFDLENLIEYIKENRRKFNTFDICDLIDEKPKEKTFNLTKIENTKLSTVSPILGLNVFVKEISLLRSFYENRNSQVDSSLFMKSFEYFELNFDIKGMKTLLDFAKRVKQPLDLSIIQKHMIVLTDRIFGNFIQCFAGNGFVNNLSSEIKEKIERKLGQKIDKNLILYYTKNKNIAAFVDADPVYFLDFFKDEPDFKVKQIPPLLSFLSNPLFPIDFIFDFCLRMFVIFPDMTSSKKKSAFTRFLLMCCEAVKTEKTAQQKFFIFIKQNLPNLIQVCSDSCYLDIFRILKYLIPFLDSNNLPSYFTNAISLPYNSILLPLFIELLFTVSLKNMTTFNLTQSYIENCFNYSNNRASTIAAIMRSLSLLTDVTFPNNNMTLSLKVFPILFNYFGLIELNFLLSQNFSDLVYSLLTNSNSNLVPTNFCDKIKVKFLSDKRKACICYCLEFLVHLGIRDIDLIKYLFSLPFDNEYLMNSIEESYGLTLQITTDENSIRSIKNMFISLASERFVSYPNARLGRFLLSVLQSAKHLDVPQFLFNNLSKKSRDFVTLFSVLGVFLNQQKFSTEECAKCVDIEAFKLQSRSQSMMLICSGSKENHGLAFEIAASETEDVSMITQEYEKFLHPQ